VGLGNGELPDIVGGDSLEEWSGTGSHDPYPAHMTHVEEPDMGTDGMILVHNTAVLDRHLPSSEVDEFSATSAMLCDERSLLHV
jgi:hypothetical protein